ncbi:beta-galactoside-binding lectin-like [Cololabis saira]|uniref:beta-galactoside-binding lectin-like n=1 Tax=Cololabis saira TaxID=129043 RepID=UPI002AD33F8D|nr:beta-galactoside-binding lectin-like [Cololabis saira]
MAGMIVNQMSFKAGKILTLNGVIPSGAKNFCVNIGINEENVALHINPRLNSHGETNKLVLNSKCGGKWQAELREGGFPFYQGQAFKIIIIFTPAGFVVVLSDGSTIRFPNRLGALKYNFFSFVGDVRIKSFEIV